MIGLMRMVSSDGSSDRSVTIGPGSRPPPNRTRAAMRSAIAGWVASHLPPTRSSSLSIIIACTWPGSAGMAERASILRSAVIIASGSLVSSTAPASARNSRLRESAKRSPIAST